MCRSCIPCKLQLAHWFRRSAALHSALSFAEKSLYNPMNPLDLARYDHSWQFTARAHSTTKPQSFTRKSGTTKVVHEPHSVIVHAQHSFGERKGKPERRRGKRTSPRIEVGKAVVYGVADRNSVNVGSTHKIYVSYNGKGARSRQQQLKSHHQPLIAAVSTVGRAD